MTRFPQANLRVIVMLASLVVIVGAGYLVRQRVGDDTVASFRLVSHTHEVRAALHELNASLSELQAAAFSAKLNGKDVSASERYTDARTRITPLVDRLRDLTQDNPEQQESIGSLRARIEERVDLFDRSMKDSTALKNAELTTAVSRIPVEDIAKTILGREQALADERQLSADSAVAFARWVTALTALAQVLLLGAVVWISDRQLQRRIAAESETRQAVGRARLIVETVREPIAVITAELRVLQANQAFFEFYGLAKPFTGSLGDVPAWNDPALRQRLKDVVTTRRELWDYEIRQETGGDTARNVIVNARPMTLPDSGDVTALVTVSDMTVRKRAEEQVLELNRQLSGKIEQVSEVNRELEAFSYSVSHDLRAPLRHIAGFSEKLRGQLVEQGDTKLQHYCEVIADSTRRMSALIEDLLSYSRLGRHAIRLHTVDMQSLVDESRSTLMSSHEGRRIEWRIAPLPIVVADAGMLRLVWQNLLDNAIKYSAGKDPAVIEIGVDDTPTERVFRVRDNGAGFDMKYVDKLFGVFQRLHKASAFEGTGIGLASVRRIVARHGGRTWAEGAPDQGATIYFSLPRHEPIA